MIAAATTLPIIAGWDPNRLQGDTYTYDHTLAARAVNFFGDCLVHVNNSRYTRAFTPLELAPWQEDIISVMFGCVHRETGLRRFRQGLKFVARKNGKSTLCAGLSLYALYCDREAGGENYCVASALRQSQILSRVAEKMVRANKKLNARSTINKTQKRIDYDGSFFQAMPADAGGLHGLNSHFVICDEVHALPMGGFEIWDVISTGGASRAQPMLLGISTAGHDQATKCYELYEYACSVRDGTMDDPLFFPAIYEAPRGCALDDWDAIKAANPNLGISVSLEYIEGEMQRAVSSSSFENAYRTLHLNQWVQQRTRWLNMDDWRACVEA